MLLHIGCAARLGPSGLSLSDRQRSTRRQTQLRTVAEGRRPDQNPRSRKGASIENKKRRKGRPAWTRKPDDTPFRDGNRDRLVGLLTERAARTLCYYLSETNLNVHHWLMSYMQRNPIPRSGAWDDVSGETFLRTLLSMPLEHAKWTTGRDPLYDNIPGCGVDPRNLAQRVMAIRSQLSLEFIEDLRDVSEENSTLLRECLVSSLSMSFDDMPVAEKPVLEKDSPQSADSAVVADKKGSVAINKGKDTPGSTNTAVSEHKKDPIPPASNKAYSAAADSAASAIASLQRSFESSPVAEKPVLKKDTTPPASKQEHSSPVPADKKASAIAADKKGRTVSADKKASAIAADKKGRTVSADKKVGAVSADKKGRTVSGNKKTGAGKKASAGKKAGAVSAEKIDSTVSDSKGNPVSADTNDQETSVSMDGETA